VGLVLKPDDVDGRETLWTCAACGKTGPDRDTLGDVSCFVNSVLVYADSIVYEDGRAVRCDAVENIESRRCDRCWRWVTVTSAQAKGYCPHCDGVRKGVESE
jgi:hypothetical protein